MFRALWVAVAAFFSFATAAEAATIVGSSGPGYTDRQDRLNLSTGRYRVTMTTSAPVTDAYIYVHMGSDYHFYDPTDPTAYLGGNDFDFYRSTTADGPVTQLGFWLTVDRPYDTCFASDFCEEGYFWADGIEYGFFSATDQSYSIDVRYMGAVPEPAVWALMILGFGVVGAGMRSRRDRLAPVPA